ncbi:MAG: hypothetical protein AABW49_03160 [Nanoarchaeota archaeon]
MRRYQTIKKNIGNIVAIALASVLASSPAKAGITQIDKPNQYTPGYTTFDAQGGTNVSKNPIPIDLFGRVSATVDYELGNIWHSALGGISIPLRNSGVSLIGQGQTVTGTDPVIKFGIKYEKSGPLGYLYLSPTICAVGDKSFNLSFNAVRNFPLTKEISLSTMLESGGALSLEDGMFTGAYQLIRIGYSFGDLFMEAKATISESLTDRGLETDTRYDWLLNLKF